MGYTSIEEDGTPPASDGLLESAGSMPVNHCAYRDQPWEGRYSHWQQPEVRRSGLWESYVQPVGKRIVESDSQLASCVTDIVKLMEDTWFWRSSTASPSMLETSTSSRHDSASSHSPSHRRGPNAGAVPLAAEHSSSSLGGRQRERGRADVSSPSGNPSQAAQISARRTQSADIGDLEPAERSPGQRAHSYAADDIVNATVSDGQSSRRTSIQGAADPNPALGTWAQRVFRFQPGAKGGHKASAPTHIPGTPDVADLRKQVKQQKPVARLANSKSKSAESEEEEEEELARNAAWRWRFNRRWRTEQAKQLDPDYGMDGLDEDGWDEALKYLDACGPGFHLQIARTTSVERDLARSSLLSQGSDLSTLLMEDSQKEPGALKEQAEMDATKSIVSMAKKAQDLYVQQQQIEKQVQQRWGNTKLSGMSWAGQYVPAVQIDSYGQFPFVLMKISDRTSAHRLLVRGKNGATEAQLVHAVMSEVKVACKEHKLEMATVTLLGTGTMEWSRERDRRINVAPGRVEKGCDPSIHSCEDVVRLAGALTRSSLPMNYRIMLNGEKLS